MIYAIVCVSWLSGFNASSGLMLPPVEGVVLMADREGYVPPNMPDGVWHALCSDSGASVVVCSRNGEILFANQAASRWLRFQMRRLGNSGPGISPPAHIEQSYPAASCAECLAFIQRVCGTQESITYESIVQEIRYRVTMRPIPAESGTTHALMTTRRIEPWERTETHIDASVTPVVVQEHDPGVLATLSTREVEVLILIGEGYSYAQIAERLHRSVRTIERHRDRLGQKLHATDRVQLARFAIRAGLSGLPTPAEKDELDAQGWDPIQLSDPIRAIANRRVRASN